MKSINFTIFKKIWLKSRLLILWLILSLLLVTWARKFYLEYKHIIGIIALPSITIGRGYERILAIFLALILVIFFIINRINKKMDIKFIITTLFNYFLTIAEIIMALFVGIILWNSKIHPSAVGINIAFHYIYYLILGFSAYYFIEIIRKCINDFIKKKFSST